MLINLQSIFLHIPLSKGSGENKTGMYFLWDILEYSPALAAFTRLEHCAKKLLSGKIKRNGQVSLW
jgi:hypothetical protein